MEGLTTSVWRRVFRDHFDGADEYYTPFISPNGNCSFQTKEIREISTGEEHLIPQLLSNNAQHFLWAIREMKNRGFNEVNLNFGCPSGTVVAKRKGSGMLTDPKELDNTLSEIFDFCPDGIKISIKTRIGRYTTDEWENILEVYNKYPLSKLIVHPRVQKEFYKGSAHKDIFLKYAVLSKNPLFYNGDLFTVGDIKKMLSTNSIEGVMIGRGALMNPAIFRQVQGGEKATRKELITYHDQLVNEYYALYKDENTAVGKMKELWSYFSESFENPEKFLKSIRKAHKLADYKDGANRILNECELKTLPDDYPFKFE